MLLLFVLYHFFLLKTEDQKCDILFAHIRCRGWNDFACLKYSVTSPQAQRSSAEGSSLANVSLWSSVELMWSNRRERFWKTAQSKLGQSTGANENSHLSFREQGLCDWCWTFGGRPSAFNRRVALPVGCRERERKVEALRFWHLLKPISSLRNASSILMALSNASPVFMPLQFQSTRCWTQGVSLSYAQNLVTLQTLQLRAALLFVSMYMCDFSQWLWNALFRSDLYGLQLVW